MFNWREVACSPECGIEYLRLIDASRSKVADPGPEQVSVRLARRSKLEKSIKEDVSKVEAPTFAPIDTDLTLSEAEYTEE